MITARFFLCISLIFSFKLSAQVFEIPLEERTQKPLILSETQTNRLFVEDGMITKIVGNLDVFTISLDDSLGQAFITLKVPLEKPEGLTVFSHLEEAQDFLVTSADIEPSIVILIPPKEEDIPSRPSLASIDTLIDIFAGKTPTGFIKRPFDKQETIEVGSLLSYIQSVTIFTGSLEDIFVIKLFNPQKKTLPLTNEPFSSDCNWFFCPKQFLKKNEETLIVLSKKRKK